MPIAVACKCGKQFKVKDELAGKAVRCPACKSALRIPGGAPATAGAAKSGRSSSSKVDEQAALLKFQEAQKKKQLTAEEEAAYRKQQKDLIESYDQLAGKGAATKDGKKVERPTEALPKKPTIFTKIADFFGAIAGTFIAKYIIIAVLLSGGVLGSIYIVKYVTSYMAEESSTKMSNEDRSRLLLKEAGEAIEAERWSEANDKLNQALRLNPRLEIRRDYREYREKLSKAMSATGGK